MTEKPALAWDAKMGAYVSKGIKNAVFEIQARFPEDVMIGPTRGTAELRNDETGKWDFVAWKL